MKRVIDMQRAKGNKEERLAVERGKERERKERRKKRGKRA